MSFLQNIEEEIKKIPPWGYVLIAGGAFVAYQFWKSQQTSSTTAAANTSGVPSSGADMGIPSGYWADFANSGGGSTNGLQTYPLSTAPTSTTPTPTSTTPTGQATNLVDVPATGGPPVGTLINPPGAVAGGPVNTPATLPPSAPSATPPSAPAPAPASTSYTVKSGDTLADIAAYFTSRGKSVSWQQIYSANTGTIENTARSHGFSSSDDGHWIFPGEVLTIP